MHNRMFQVDAGVGNAYSVGGYQKYVPTVAADDLEYVVGLATSVWGISVLRFHLEDEARGVRTRSNFHRVGQAGGYCEIIEPRTYLGMGE